MLGIVTNILFFVQSAHAQNFVKNKTEIVEQAGSLAVFAGLFTNVTVGGVAAQIIKSFIGLLGIIFLVLIIYAGYNWMTARGEEEKVNKAITTIQRAVIGLVIIICAYAITYFVFRELPGSGSL